LDEVEELILPDEMLQYLNLVNSEKYPKNDLQQNMSSMSPNTGISVAASFVPRPNSPSPAVGLMSPQSGNTMSALGSPYSQRNYEFGGISHSHSHRRTVTCNHRSNNESQTRDPYVPTPPVPPPTSYEPHHIIDFLPKVSLMMLSYR